MRGCLLRRAVPWAVRAASGAVRAVGGALRRVVGGEVRAGLVVRGVRCWALLGAAGRWGCPVVRYGARWRTGGRRGARCRVPRWRAPSGGALRCGPLSVAWGPPWQVVTVDRWGCRGAVCRVIPGVQWFVTDCYGTACSRVADTPGGVYRWVCQVEGDPKREDPGPPKREDRTPGQGQPNPETEPKKRRNPSGTRYPGTRKNKPPRRRAPVPPGKLSKRKPKNGYRIPKPPRRSKPTRRKPPNRPQLPATRTRRDHRQRGREALRRVD